jgi:hypothetical protein
MDPADPRVENDNIPPAIDTPEYRPIERFWPYLDLPEQPSDEELAALDPALAEALFGAPPRPFSVSLEFPDFGGPQFARALEMARASAEYLEVRHAGEVRHRARFYPQDAERLRDLFELVGSRDDTAVLIDDRPLPYARELWLPLVWFLIR